ncbi:SDR family NAD(P)-dependent oxidoreductase [Streptomyces sp. NPDC048290]|uniref:SDR family NAD(P)-dependent oxidoreductase n=1 Tax=Streptomyces sp. NPDC048290 TaxID=3155811 RepID=UPI00342D3E71
MAVNAYDLTGRTAFVTGAASGIGRASAVLLARAGATVHCADLDAPGLRETAATITAEGGTAHTHHLDVTDRARLREAVASCETLHVMAAIAGIMHSSPVLETRDEDLDRVLNINFKGVLYACQEAAHRMIARGTPGSIVTMASGAVDTGSPGLLCYGAAKAAVVQLTKTLATEVGRHGIRVNAVAPGWIRTPMTDHHTTETEGPRSPTESRSPTEPRSPAEPLSRPEAQTPTEPRPRTEPQSRTEALMSRMSPLGRVGTPEDVAHAVLHLASDAASFTTGQILRPNGGVAMPW